MRAATFLTMALTPFILNAWAHKTPSMQRKSEDTSCRSPFHTMHVDIRHTESKGVGYNTGYSTLEWFGIYDHNPNFMPFLDLRGHIFDDGQLAGNIGLGERTVISSINHIFGLYLYYDVRQEEHDLTVNQVSPGIELLGKRMEYRLNGYFPVGEDKSHSYHHKFEKFEGNRIILKSKKKYAMTGADGEIGAHLTQSTWHDVYFGIGPYYFSADPSSAWGGKTRLYWRYKESVTLEASYSYDHVFKNVVQGTVALSCPLGKKLKRNGRNCPNPKDLALSRAAFAPYRFEIPVVETRTQHKAAISSVTRRPYNVWFVNNTSSSDGTIESPFPTLAQAQNASGPNDIIYVFPGDGTTKGMNAGITLKNGQFLFGSATPQQIQATVGRIKIPPHSSTMPTITNSAGVIMVTLANGNEISGMNITSPINRTGIGNNNAAIVGVNIHDNTFSGGANHSAVVINPVSGNINISNNVLASPNNINVGINITIQDGTVNQVNMSNNNISGYALGISLDGSSAPTATGLVAISGNTIANFGVQGILITQGLSNAQFQITDNVITDTRSSAFTVNGGIGIMPTTNQNNIGRYFITGNTIVSTTPTPLTSCILISSGAVGTPTVTGRFSIQNNTLTVTSANGSYGINMNASGGSVFCASVANNTITLTMPTGTNAISISGNTGTVNVDDFSKDIASSALLSGNVNLVNPGTCR